MEPSNQDSGSDSDEEQLSGVVLLGIPDGLVSDLADTIDAAVSRIGGRPALLPSKEPPFGSSCCNTCSHPMELLVQIWCPLEGSPMDRALYVWGCARGTCQRKEGSIRAWRGLQFNAAYAERLASKKHFLKTSSASSEKAVPKTNPFSIQLQSGDSNFPNFMETNALSGPTLPTTRDDDTGQSCSDTESDQSDDVTTTTTAVVSAPPINSSWATAPSYPAIYLSTLQEYIPSQPRNKPMTESYMQDLRDDKKWASEIFENSLKLDHVFERFAKRVGFEGQQCLRYELRGIPLPFSSDAVFNRLFPVSPKASPPVTKAAFTVLPAIKRAYQVASIPTCGICRSRRVFECQLMPNLINVLSSVDKVSGSTDKNSGQASTEDDFQSDNKTKPSDADKWGMEWGTCMVFTCDADCSDDGREAWREEVVLVQWD